MKTFAVAGAAAVVLLASVPSAADAGWSIEHPKNPGSSGNFLYGVSCPAPSACSAVGYYYPNATDNGGPLAERRGANKWSLTLPPAPAAADMITQLSAVSCASPRACTAVGHYSNSLGVNVVVAERWNGQKWSLQKISNPAHSQGGELNGVSCVSAKACTAVGQYTAGDGETVPLAGRWNGSKWSLEKTPALPNSTDSYLNAVSCHSAGACMAVGTTANLTSTSTKPLGERWNGRRWSIQRAAKPAGSSDSVLSAVSCPSASACVATGYSVNRQNEPFGLAERSDGGRWKIERVPRPARAHLSYLYGVSCPASKVCTAVGHWSNKALDLFTLAERSNGKKWSIQHTPNPGGNTGALLFAVSCSSTRSCTAVGQYGSVGANKTLAERWGG